MRQTMLLRYVLCEALFFKKKNNDTIFVCFVQEYVEKALHAVGDKPLVADSDVLNRCGLFLEQNGKVARAEQVDFFSRCTFVVLSSLWS